jgi:hypothetical protein
LPWAADAHRLCANKKKHLIILISIEKSGIFSFVLQDNPNKLGIKAWLVYEKARFLGTFQHFLVFIVNSLNFAPHDFNE